MITPAEAHQLISEHLFKPEKETLSFDKTRGRISAEPILADRDLPARLGAHWAQRQRIARNAGVCGLERD